MKVFSKIGFFSLALLFSAQSQAMAADELIEGAKLCTQYLPRYERENAIPTHLLSAIASTESGRYHEGLKLKLPWPWTINANGKGYFFNSKEEAIAAVKKLRAHGIYSIDVGCMQVNLYHHPDAFSSLDKAFEPEANIAYAAGFIHNLYNQEGSWKKAAADYHSKTPSLGSGYVDLVYDSWFTIIDRLRTAKLHVPEKVVADMNEIKNNRNVITVAAGTDPASRMKTTPLPEQEGRKVASYAHPRMNSIKVTSDGETRKSSVMTGRKESDVVVFRPEIITADSTPLQIPTPVSAPKFTPSSSDELKVIPIADHRPVSDPTPQIHKSGPNFIFND